KLIPCQARGTAINTGISFVQGVSATGT
ncbi:MAG: hypothetical protein QOG25_3858, partial [Acetobacteraceae bacterium]|nr:hypothetical protein [Acetobacteraceae bacterium]